ncbi:unnamed protein product [Caenorhabditis brenneri]
MTAKNVNKPICCISVQMSLSSQGTWFKSCGVIERRRVISTMARMHYIYVGWVVTRRFAVLLFLDYRHHYWIEE